MKDLTINLNYFSAIDSSIKAYILGFIAADGAIVRNTNCSTKTLTITIHAKDVSILEKIKSELNSSLPIKVIQYKHKSLSSYKLDVDHRRFTTSKKEIISDLEKYGLTERKSLTMPDLLKYIPEEYKNSFIIGYFDGDGCFVDSYNVRTKKRTLLNGDVKYYNSSSYNSSISIKGTEEFLKSIVNYLNLSSYSLKQNRGQNIHTLVIGSNEGILKFYKLYDTCEFYLSRKKDKFARKILQVQTISST